MCISYLLKGFLASRFVSFGLVLVEILVYVLVLLLVLVVVSVLVLVSQR